MRPTGDRAEWWWVKGLVLPCTTYKDWQVVLIWPGEAPWIELVGTRTRAALATQPGTVEWRGPLEVPCSR